MKKLVGYVTAKVPDNNFTIDLVNSMYENGIDTIELGVPFSDPVADGPIIQASSEKALANGFKLTDLYEISSKIDDKKDLLWMGYFNPFYKIGFENTLKKCTQLCVSGLIIPDFPKEEALLYEDIISKYNVSIIDFIAPTDTKERIEFIAKDSKKFIYLVAYAGITGSGAKEDLNQVLQNIRSFTKTPIYVGFGVDKNSAKEKVAGADGVIVGSAFIKILLDDSLTKSEKVVKISQMSREIKDIINS